MSMLLTKVRVCFADVSIASPFQDHMVLQRGVRVPVWGEADPGRRVSVAFAGQTVEAVADVQGRWRATLEPMSASADSRTMIIRAGGESKSINDVLVGEVWLASGQSNMEWCVALAKDGPAEVAAARHPQIRMFSVRHRPASSPQEIVDGQWEVCDPKTVGNFSAVAYFFARDLHEKLNAPIGIIHSSWGGTAAQPWTPIETLRHVKAIGEQIAKYDERVDSLTSKVFVNKQSQAWAEYDATNADWLQAAAADDPGVSQKWFAPEIANDEKWPTIRLPVESTLQAWHFLGTMWLRKQIEIPADWIGKDLTLSLGAIDDADETYVNGHRVGGMWYGEFGHATAPRVYTVPAAVVKDRRVTIAIRVMNVHSFGGLLGPRESVKLSCDDASIALAGQWSCRPGNVLNRVDIPRPTDMPTPLFPDLASPANLYNGMIAPLVPYALRGVIWYQGESNAGQPEVYRELFPAMIQSWRRAWSASAEAMPFYFVQLANYDRPLNQDTLIGGWSGLRETQLMTLRSVPNTGMAVAIDLGEADIHPRNKQDVGHRLALWALAKTYGRDIAYSGPLYRSAAVEQGAIRVSFDHADGLTAKGAELAGFAIAGEDKVFHPAAAMIDGASVIVSSKEVGKPVAVRYAWATNPSGNLYNTAGLPASPFRSDTWSIQIVQAAE